MAARLLVLYCNNTAMKRYNLVNNVLGWVAFAVAAVTYLLTIEPTASFWDCPEFIVQGTKLEVGHPPGNPIFMLTARFFVTLLGSFTSAAVAVNTMSALLSAATILLLFWTVTHFARRLMVRDDSEPTGWQTAIIMAAGMCAALAYAWSDTFWFSAVEGEVYAFSSFCTALVVWLMLKWENRADHIDSDRYLVLIAYVIGFSIGVHLLNLLCIPALCLIYYYRKGKNINVKGSIVSLAVSVLLLAAVLYGLVPGIIRMAQKFELLFVNIFGFGYNTGVLFYAGLMLAVTIATIAVLYNEKTSRTTGIVLTLLTVLLSGMVFINNSVLIGILLILALAVLAVVYAKRLTRRFLALVVLSIGVIFIGYSSYALLLIRSTASTPMNQNAPDNVFSLSGYLNREQYGERPLLYGGVFAEALEEFEYPEGSGSYYVTMDRNGRPKTKVLDGYLRDQNGSPFSTTEMSYTKVVKADPSEPDRYVKELSRPSYKTVPDLSMLLPRIYSTDQSTNAVQGYKSWANYVTPDIYDIPETVRDRWAQNGYAPHMEVMRYLPHLSSAATYVNSESGEPLVYDLVWKPGFDVNLRYFVNYQLNHMYWRYFMWNFAGRQNDIQGNGEPHLGNWISGIPFIDDARLGDQSLLPDEFGKGNKGHNVFYMLPLLLGLLGLLMQALYKNWTNEGRGIEQFWVVFFLFFMTGIAIVLYLNQTPSQPRERDYAYAGSFYAFAMWIGLGIPALAVLLQKMLKKATPAIKVATAVVAWIVALGVPLQMVSQTWDDHDRSGRYTTRDFGFDYLSSVDENGIIFSNGDNDTFPLWYAQEVEGYRTDVRVVNLSYLTTDWYASQMVRPAYEAAAVPMLAQPKDWQYERLAYSYIMPTTDTCTNVFTSLADLYNYDESKYGALLLTAPDVKIPIDADAAMSHYSTGDAALDSLYIRPYIGDVSTDLSAFGRGINQSKVLSLDIVANSLSNIGKRPVYFAMTVPTSYYLGLTPYLSCTGLAYEVTPFKDGDYSVTAQKSYNAIVTKYRWGGIDKDGADLYLDETVRRMVASVRMAILTVAEDLINLPDIPASEASKAAAAEAGLPAPATQADMGRQLLDLMGEKLPESAVDYDTLHGFYEARAYYTLYLHQRRPEDLDKAEQIVKSQLARYAQYVRYGASLDYSRLSALGSDMYAMSYLGEAVVLSNRIAMLKAEPALLDDPDYAEKWEDVNKSDISDDLLIAPILYINGYTAEDILQEYDLYSFEDRMILDDALSTLALHERTGIATMALSEELMQEYGFTAEQWGRLHR